MRLGIDAEKAFERKFENDGSRGDSFERNRSYIFKAKSEIDIEQHFD